MKIFTATGEKSIRAHQIHSSCGSRIKKRCWCPKVNFPVERDEIRRGYEYSKNRYILLSEEDFSKIPLDTTCNIELSQFTQLAEIDPVCTKQTYDLAPRQVGEKAFQLLLEALNTSGRVGIGKFSLREKEQLVLLRPFGKALALEILFYPDEIHSSNEITELDGLEKIQTNPKELALALQLVGSQSEPFRPEQYQDHFRGCFGTTDRTKDPKTGGCHPSLTRTANPRPDSRFAEVVGRNRDPEQTGKTKGFHLT